MVMKGGNSSRKSQAPGFRDKDSGFFQLPGYGPSGAECSGFGSRFRVLSLRMEFRDQARRFAKLLYQK